MWCRFWLAGVSWGERNVVLVCRALRYAVTIEYDVLEICFALREDGNRALCTWYVRISQIWRYLNWSTAINDRLRIPSSDPPHPASHSKIPVLSGFDSERWKQIWVRCRLTKAEFFRNSSSKINLKLYLSILANHHCTYNIDRKIYCELCVVNCSLVFRTPVSARSYRASVFLLDLL